MNQTVEKPKEIYNYCIGSETGAMLQIIKKQENVCSLERRSYHILAHCRFRVFLSNWHPLYWMMWKVWTRAKPLKSNCDCFSWVYLHNLTDLVEYYVTWFGLLKILLFLLELTVENHCQKVWVKSSDVLWIWMNPFEPPWKENCCLIT